MTPDQSEVLRVMGTAGYITDPTANEIASATGLRWRQVLALLVGLSKLGLVRCDDKGHWTLTEKGWDRQ